MRLSAKILKHVEEGMTVRSVHLKFRGSFSMAEAALKASVIAPQSSPVVCYGSDRHKHPTPAVPHDLKGFCTQLSPKEQRRFDF